MLQIRSYLFNRYDSTTGVFTVPPGADGVYYFSSFLLTEWEEQVFFHMELNGRDICNIEVQNNEYNSGTSSCNAVVKVNAGDKIKVVYLTGTDTTPLIGGTWPVNGFSGFRI